MKMNISKAKKLPVRIAPFVDRLIKPSSLSSLVRIAIVSGIEKESCV